MQFTTQPQFVPPRPPAAKDPLVGLRAGPVSLRARVSEGHTCTLYRAVDDAGVPAAVKVLRPDRAKDPSALGRFLQEGISARALRHPNVVRVDGIGRFRSGEPYVLMEWLEGRTLDSFPAGALKLDAALSLILQASDALTAVHEKGLVHRDVTLQNLLLVLRDGEPVLKLIDFGIACRADGVPTLSGGAVFGTPPFMSPEQWRGEPLDARSDLYSLAVVAFRLFTGRMPFSGSSVRELYQAHRNGPIPFATHLRPAVPPAVANVIHRAMSKRREDRHDDVATFARALRRAAYP